MLVCLGFLLVSLFALCVVTLSFHLHLPWPRPHGEEKLHPGLNGLYFHSHFTHNNCHLWVQTNVLMIQFLYLAHSIKCLQTNIAVYIFFFGYKLCCMYSGHSFYVCLQIQQLSIYFSYEMSYDACVLDTPFMHTNTAAAHIFFV